MPTPPSSIPPYWPDTFHDNHKITASDLNGFSGATQFMAGHSRPADAPSNSMAPTFQVHGNAVAPGTGGTGGDYKRITQGMSSVSVDIDSAGGWSTTNGTYTIQANGMYVISLGLQAASSPGDLGQITLGIGGIAKIGSVQSGHSLVASGFERSNTVSGNDVGASITAVAYLTAGTTVWGQTLVASGQTATWPANWYLVFSARWISA